MTIYLLYGDDEFAIGERVAELKAQQRARSGGEYNLDELDGRVVAPRELLGAAETVPFLADQRLVIVTGLLARLSGGARPRGRKGSAASDDELEQTLGRLGALPATTVLVLVEASADPALLAGRIPSGRLRVEQYARPKPWELESWIAARAKRLGGAIEPAAVRLLASLGIEEPRQLDQELRKLFTYAAGRPVRPADVQLLVAGATNVFAFLDAVADGRRGAALAALRALVRQGERAEALLPQLAALVRRLLVLALLREARRDPERDGAAYGLNPRTAGKLARQARRFSVAALEAAYRKLLDLDRQIKTGQADPEPALELLVAELT